MIFLGCDGGSTKTEFMIANETGELLSHLVLPGCNYGYLGYSGFEALFKDAFDRIRAETGILGKEITFAAFGLPAYGEVEETESTIPEILSRLISPERIRIVNDSVVGWSGSLSAHPGINIVSGTGSISYGVDPKGNEMRVGGWSLVFCDEGSCSWIGRQAIRAFTMQCDGRLPRTALYDLFKKHFSLNSKDIYFSNTLLEVPNNSSLLAEIQMIALNAFRMGDLSVVPFYDEAAALLVESAIAIRSHLDFDLDQPVMVSYSGGLFKAGKLIMEPFLAKLKENQFCAVEPKYPPSIGSLALAAAKFLDQKTLDVMLEKAYQESKK